MLTVECILNTEKGEVVSGMDLSKEYCDKTLKEDSFKELWKTLGIALFRTLQAMDVFVDSKEIWEKGMKNFGKDASYEDWLKSLRKVTIGE